MAMDNDAHHVLLISDDPAVTQRILTALAELPQGRCTTIQARDLSIALGHLGRRGIDAILLDLFLPDSQGMSTFEQIFAAAPSVPILILEGTDDEDVARHAVRRGAKDRVVKEGIDRSFALVLRHMLEGATAEDALFVERERAQVTLNSIGDGVISTNQEGRVTYLNPVAEKMTGWSQTEASGRMLSDVFKIIDGDTREPAPDPMEIAVRLNRVVGLPPRSVLVRRDGSESGVQDSIAPIHARDGQVTGAVMVFRDVSDARSAEVKLLHLAQHDFLTDLPNRMLLNDRLDQAIDLAQRHGNKVAVLFLDLDHFKHINDSLGHAIGDKLLEEVAKRLVAAVRRSDTVSRQGGDEFIVVLPDIADSQSAARQAKKVLALLSAAHAIGEHDLHVNVSIGISIFPDDGPNAETLIKCADTAMYQAKDNGRNRYQFFKPEMNVRAVERQSIEAHLCRALERREFVLHYQLKTNLETAEISGVEALIRWMHPDRGLLLPAQFIPIAEDCGLIVPIGQWILREACRQSRAWQAAGLPPVPVAVNISAVEFRHNDFLAGVGTILAETGLEPRYLELEVTESVLMQDVESTAVVLRALKSMGVLLAVDDFGTGYSSLTYLRHFPIDALKIDRSFVKNSTIDPDDAAIVGAVIGLGKNLRQRVIAEGVETREQAVFLKTRLCDEGQGYYFGRPVGAEEFAQLLGGRQRPLFASTQVTTLSTR